MWWSSYSATLRETKAPRQRRVPAESPEEHFKRTISISFLDHLTSHLTVSAITVTYTYCIEMSCCSMKFSDTKKKAIQGPGLCLVSLAMHNLKEMADVYRRVYLPSPESLDMELACWEEQWKDLSADRPCSTLESHTCADGKYFPNIRTLLQLWCTLFLSQPAAANGVYVNFADLSCMSDEQWVKHGLNGLAL